MKILSIESSCDETSASVIENSKILSNIIYSQNFHSKYGGVIPELASRAHLDVIYSVVQAAFLEAKSDLNDIDAIAVTTQPGLIGSLLVGSNFAKALSIKFDKPIIPVNHIEGHLYSACIDEEKVEFPFISLVVSGGHTSLFVVESYSKYTMIGATIDDAAGEAFDKAAALLGLGYPGGPLIDKLAKNGNPKAFTFPRPMLKTDDYNFSFSGLKTSIRYFIHKEFNNNVPDNLLNDFCASLQQAIVDVLTFKTFKAAENYNIKKIMISGGVSANSKLREDFTNKAKIKGFQVTLPSMEYCIDNAAMIGFLAEKRILENKDDYRDLKFKVNSVSLKANKN